MKLRALCQGASVACVAGAWLLVPPTGAIAREFASWFVRPAVLPFAFGALAEASRAGDATETFARAQQVLHLLPTWTDGYAVFAYRHALDGGDLARSAAERAAAAHRRLQQALAWLEAARAGAGRREVELLQSMAFLPEVAVAQEPGLADLLRAAGGAPALADAYLAAAERASRSPAVREQRTFLAPRLAAGLLAAGDRARALLVLETAIARSAEVRDQTLAAEWRARLDEARRWLAGEPGVDLEAVRADPRMAPLLPHLRGR